MTKDSHSVEDYWNRNLDPLNQMEKTPPGFDERWLTACRAYLNPDTLAALAALGDMKGRKVLVPASGLGCGCVHLARRGAEVTGVDIAARRTELSREMVHRHFPDLNIRFLTADAEHLPLEDASFDAVFSRDLLMYGDRARIVAEQERILAPGGRAVFMEALADHPLIRLYRRFGWAESHRSFTHYLHYADMENLSASMKSCGTKPYYFLSLAAFFPLFRWGSERGFRMALTLLHPADAALFRLLPPLRKRAWRAVAVCQKD